MNKFKLRVMFEVWMNSVSHLICWYRCCEQISTHFFFESTIYDDDDQHPKVWPMYLTKSLKPPNPINWMKTNILFIRTCIHIQNYSLEWLLTCSYHKCNFEENIYILEKLRGKKTPPAKMYHQTEPTSYNDASNIHSIPYEVGAGKMLWIGSTL